MPVCSGVGDHRLGRVLLPGIILVQLCTWYTFLEIESQANTLKHDPNLFRAKASARECPPPQLTDGPHLPRRAGRQEVLASSTAFMSKRKPHARREMRGVRGPKEKAALEIAKT